MKKINIKTRLVEIDGKPISQLKITNAIRYHYLNQKLNLEWGWQRIGGTECTTDKPQTPPGEYGVYLCVNGQWVWVPA